MRRALIFLLGLAISTASHAQQHVEHLFHRTNYTMYVGSGDLDGKRVVSDMQITPKDSSNREIHVKLTILTDWKVTDSLQLDLVLDPLTKSVIQTPRDKKEGIRYSSKNADVFIVFETPSVSTHYTQSKEKITVWSSNWASVNFPEKLQKYQMVLNTYHEK